MATNPEDVISIDLLKEVLKRTRLSKSGLYQKIKEGCFPRPIKLGKRKVGWLSVEVSEWINAKIEESRQGDAKEIREN